MERSSDKVTHPYTIARVTSAASSIHSIICFFHHRYIVDLAMIVEHMDGV